MKKAVLACSIVLGLAALLPAMPPPEQGSIRADDLRRDVTYLSSDGLAGRDTGEPGIRKAEKYIAKEFRKAGLSPLPGQSDYFIDFSLYRLGYDADGTSLEVGIDDGEASGRAGVDFRPFPFSDEGVVEAPVVFLGYGITAPEHDYDDYEGIDVEGKIALVLRHEPGEQDPTSSFDGTASSGHALFETKGSNAREHGAVGMILVTDPLHHGPDDDLRLVRGLRLTEPERPEPSEESDVFLAVHVSQEIAAQMVSSAGHSLEEMQRAIDGGESPSRFPLGNVTARIAVERAEDAVTVPARNVAAFLEGSDPERKDEWVLIGGHHDHVGGYRGEGDTVFNGADDNASGTSGVLALARAFAGRPEWPRRSLVFVTFSAEEKGLLGSRALVEQELIPTDKVVFMLNLDMIGRNPDKAVQLFGDGYMRGLREITESANDGIDLSIEYAGAGYAGNSDHDPFYNEGIPFMFFFTGVHDDYHQLGDHADKLDYQRMESILSVAYGVVDRIAGADEAPGLIHHIAWLGARVEVLDEGDGPQAIVTGVDGESRAAGAGMAVGDVIVAFGGEELNDPERVGRHFHDVDPGSSVALGVRRGGADLVVEIERAKTGYMGVAPGPLDEDQRSAHGLHSDEGIVLRRVMEGGPSERGGLKVGDIVIRISGRPVGPMNLGRRLMQIGAGETVDITVIREGERLTFPVTLGERPRSR